MRRYYIKYGAEFAEILALLPTRIELHDKVNNHLAAVDNRDSTPKSPLIPYFSKTAGFISELTEMIEVALSDDEAAELRNRGIMLYEKNMRMPQHLSQEYDSPGPDPRFQNSNFPGLINQPSEWGRVYSASFQVPGVNRTEFYHRFTGRDTWKIEHPFAVQHVNDRSYETTSIYGGKMVQSNQYRMGNVELWRRGITGAGVRMMVIDGGYSGTKPHQDLNVPNSRTYNAMYPDNRDRMDDAHHTSMLSIAGARATGETGVVGNAYECELWSGQWADIGAAIEYGLSLGILIYSMSFAYTPDEYLLAVLEKGYHSGAVFCVAAGNGVSGAFRMQDLCNVPWTTPVGGTIGGLTVQHVNRFRLRNILPPDNGANYLRFCWPSFVVGANYQPALGSWGDQYRQEGGTSPSTSQLASTFTQLQQLYHKSKPRSIRESMHKYCDTFIDPIAPDVIGRLPNIKKMLG